MRLKPSRALLRFKPSQIPFCSFRCGMASDWSDDDSGSSSPTRWVFSLRELRSATNGFNFDNKLGEGRFGTAYWGQLSDGSQITVKKLNALSSQMETDFASEVEVLGRTRHGNLLTLRGYCTAGQERFLVYDYMPNLSLLAHLHGTHSGEHLLDWRKRMSIAIGSAQGIAYLHHQVTPQIIHMDIKASNILLDSGFQPHVAFFGLAKLAHDGATASFTGKAKGVLGYIAPEYIASGNASESCDIYSFGILLLELVSGRRPIEASRSASKKSEIRQWALPLARERRFREIADPKMNSSYVVAELKRLVLVALACTQRDPRSRPTMLEVVALLKGRSKGKLLKPGNDEVFEEEASTSSRAAGEDLEDELKKDPDH